MPELERQPIPYIYLSLEEKQRFASPLGDPLPEDRISQKFIEFDTQGGRGPGSGDRFKSPQTFTYEQIIRDYTNEIHHTTSVTLKVAKEKAIEKFDKLYNNNNFQLWDSGDPNEPKQYIYVSDEELGRVGKQKKAKSGKQQLLTQEKDKHDKKKRSSLRKIRQLMIGGGTVAAALTVVAIAHEVSIMGHRNVANSRYDIFPTPSLDATKDNEENKVELIPLQTTETLLGNEGGCTYYEITAPLNRGEGVALCVYNKLSPYGQDVAGIMLKDDSKAYDAKNPRNPYVGNDFYPPAQDTTQVPRYSNPVRSGVVVWPPNSIAWPKNVQTALIKVFLRIEGENTEIKDKKMYGIFTTKEKDGKKIQDAVISQGTNELGGINNISTPIILNHLGFTNKGDTRLSIDAN